MGQVDAGKPVDAGALRKRGSKRERERDRVRLLLLLLLVKQKIK